MMREETSSQAEIEAEAAAWLARLANEARTARDEAAFRTWLEGDPRRRAAFDDLTTVWQAAGGLKTAPARPSRRRLPVLAAAAAVVLTAAGGLAYLALTPEARRYEAPLGEQRRLALEDGSFLTLDTDTRVEVVLSGRRREVRLERGRARFEVARDAERPFVVEAGGRQAIALGTAFDVSRDAGDQVSVLLVEGSVAVAAVPGGPTLAILAPGERMTFTGARTVLDRPDVARESAWSEGRLIFDNDRLDDAVAAMNRSSRRRLAVGDPRVGEMRISGVYAAGDVEAFATSLTAFLPVAVRKSPAAIVLEAAGPGDG